MSADRSAGRLFVVSTPIGNMGDFSFRAVEVLKGVRQVLAEDTRHSRRLLQHYGIETPMLSYHGHNEARTTPRLVERLAAGEDLALITDAGTPLLSDPGHRLVRAAIAADIDVIAVPGASALLAGLVASGLDTERFTFFGFLPRQGRARTETMDALVDLGHTAVLFEAPPRVADTLSALAAAGAADRAAVVARELTKQFEELRRGTVGELAAYYSKAPIRGEVVIMLAGREERPPDLDAVRDRARSLRSGGMTVRDVTVALMEEFDVARNEAYRVAREAE